MRDEFGYIVDNDGDLYAVKDGLLVQTYVPETREWVIYSKPHIPHIESGAIPEKIMLKKTGGVRPIESK